MVRECENANSEVGGVKQNVPGRGGGWKGEGEEREREPATYRFEGMPSGHKYVPVDADEKRSCCQKYVDNVRESWLKRMTHVSSDFRSYCQMEIIAE